MREDHQEPQEHEQEQIRRRPQHDAEGKPGPQQMRGCVAIDRLIDGIVFAGFVPIALIPCRRSRSHRRHPRRPELQGGWQPRPVRSPALHPGGISTAGDADNHAQL
jgi:hypothetical protein